MNAGELGRESFGLLCLAELRKLRGRGLLAAVLLFGAVHGVAAALAIKGMELLGHKFIEGQGQQDVGDPLDFSVAGELALNLAITPVNGFALLLLFSIVWAEDFALGTMAMIFSRPVDRWRVFAAKFATALTCGFASLSLAVITGLTLGLALFGTTSDATLLENAPLVGWMAEVPELPARLARTLSGVLAGTLLLVPAVAVAALIGNLTRSPVMTLFGSMLALFADFFVHSVLGVWGGSELESSELVLEISKWNIWAGRDLFDVHGLWAASWASQSLDSATAAIANAADTLSTSSWDLLWQPMSATLLWGMILGAMALGLFCNRDVT